MRIDQKRVRYVASIDPGDEFDEDAFYGTRRIGWIRCDCESNRVQIFDLHVDEEVLRGSTFMRRLLPLLFDSRSSRKLRRLGIGRKLLERALSKMDAAGIEEVWGCVTRDDLKKTPFLLEMYSRRGFRIFKADVECIPKDAVKKIIRRL